jgi:type II secretory pathway component GspD/PulD (secretin)
LRDIQYIDVGVNIGFGEAVEDGEKLRLVVNASVSSLAPALEGSAAGPIIRQNTWTAEVLIPIGKPSVIFSSDNVENKGRTQLELTATRMD